MSGAILLDLAYEALPTSTYKSQVVEKRLLIATRLAFNYWKNVLLDAILRQQTQQSKSICQERRCSQHERTSRKNILFSEQFTTLY